MFKVFVSVQGFGFKSIGVPMSSLALAKQAASKFKKTNNSGICEFEIRNEKNKVILKTRPLLKVSKLTWYDNSNINY